MFDFEIFVNENIEEFGAMNEVLQKHRARKGARKGQIVYKCVNPDGTPDENHVVKNRKCVTKTGKMRKADKKRNKKRMKTMAKDPSILRKAQKKSRLTRKKSGES